jgi:hypothetical protein
VILLGWVVLVLLVHALRTAISSPPTEPRPSCATCGARFLEARGVDLHRRAAHPDTFDDRQVLPAHYRPEGT